MKVDDESLWQQQRSELIADGEIGQKFLEFLEEWVAEAEKSIESGATPAEAVRTALVGVEQRLGRIGTTFVGQMLVVMLAQWIHRDRLAAGLTPIEMHLVQDIAAIKVAELAEQAETTDEQEGDTAE